MIWSKLIFVRCECLAVLDGLGARDVAGAGHGDVLEFGEDEVVDHVDVPSGILVETLDGFIVRIEAINHLTAHVSLSLVRETDLDAVLVPGFRGLVAEKHCVDFGIGPDSGKESQIIPAVAPDFDGSAHALDYLEILHGIAVEEYGAHEQRQDDGDDDRHSGHDGFEFVHAISP